MPGPFYPKNDVGAINKLVDKRSPRTESEGVVTMVEKTGFVWVQIRGASNSVVVDTTNGIAVKQGDKVALRRLPGSSRWSIYAIQTLNGLAGSGSSLATTGSDVSVAAPENLVVEGTYGGIFVRWTPPNDTGDLLFEVDISTDAIGTGSTIYKVAGGLFYYATTTLHYARVRSLGTGWQRSGFTLRLSATPLLLTEIVKAHETPFAYNTTSPLVLRSIAAGGQVERVRLIITTAFNGAPSLTVGDSGNNSRLLSATDNRPSFIASYEITPDYIYSASDVINLYITVGGATLGAGMAVVESS